MSLFGDGLLEVLSNIDLGVFPSTRRVLKWLRRSASRPPGLELPVQNGKVFTGVAVLAESRVILLFAFPHERQASDIIQATQESPLFLKQQEPPDEDIDAPLHQQVHPAWDWDR